MHPVPCKTSLHLTGHNTLRSPNPERSPFLDQLRWGQVPLPVPFLEQFGWTFRPGTSHGPGGSVAPANFPVPTKANPGDLCCTLTESVSTEIRDCNPQNPQLALPPSPTKDSPVLLGKTPSLVQTQHPSQNSSTVARCPSPPVRSTCAGSELPETQSVPVKHPTLPCAACEVALGDTWSLCPKCCPLSKPWTPSEDQSVPFPGSTAIGY